MEKSRKLLLKNHLNSQVSEISFKKSCERVQSIVPTVDLRYLSSILIDDDEEKSFIYHDSNLYVWYFAIGSMINPISVYLRNLTPLISYPARCPGYRLVFRDRCGMADIEECPDGEFDGVVHLLPIDQMIRLDEVEHMYQRITVNVIDYHQRSHCVCVYKMNSVDDEERPETLPTERYLDIIIKGCEYFSVRSSYIDQLKNEQEVIPRKCPQQYQKVENIPNGVFFTEDELARHNGDDSNLPIWISINGKILEYIGLPSIDDPNYEHEERFYDFIRSYFAGREVALVIARTWYEPMYPIPLNDQHLCDGHRALAEDMCASWGLNNFGEQGRYCWKPIGRLFSN